MNDVTLITEFLGWCTIINYTILMFSTLMIILAGDWVKKIHSSLLNIPIDKLDSMYFSYLANFKLVVLVFNLVPYLSLKIMS